MAIIKEASSENLPKEGSESVTGNLDVNNYKKNQCRTTNNKRQRS